MSDRTSCACGRPLPVGRDRPACCPDCGRAVPVPARRRSLLLLKGAILLTTLALVAASLSKGIDTVSDNADRIH
jgi:hypothetical protein